MDKKLKKYPKTKIFKVVDTFSVPHPYCIGAQHIGCSDDGVLDIKGAERKGAICDVCRHRVHGKMQDKILSFEEHKQALVIEIKSDKELVKDVPGLQKYLESIKARCEKDGYVGFVFKKGTKC